MPPPRRDSAVASADETRQEIFELCELDLPLALARARTPREDVEDAVAYGR
jgi:hypothetical protein